ncbi:MAG: hypothetical protein Fur002_05020 [Anaerolineales bacterium]
MKIIFRILSILLAAAVIGGAIYAAVNAMSSASSFDEGGEELRPMDKFARPDGHDGDGFRPGHEERERDFDGRGFFLPFGMVKALALISVTAAAYYFAAQFTRKQKRIAV